MLKYIVLVKDQREYMFVFPGVPEVEHKEMSRVIKGMQRHRIDRTRHFGASLVVSAGFIDSSGMCGGCSESLGIASRGLVDTALYASGCVGVAKQ